jgi:hypothetical protein
LRELKDLREVEDKFECHSSWPPCENTLNFFMNLQNSAEIPNLSHFHDLSLDKASHPASFLSISTTFPVFPLNSPLENCPPSPSLSSHQLTQFF